MATTEAATESGTVAGVEPEFPPHRMTVDRYRRLVESGVYGPDDPVFLWKGRLVEEMTKGDPHAFSSSSLVGLMARLVPGGWAVRPDRPIVLRDQSMPEPDLAVVPGTLRDYVSRPPNARDLALVAEVSDSSLAQDSVTKLRAYAAEGIPVYWIVNIPGHRIAVYSRPSGPAEIPSSWERREYGPDEEVPVVLDGREVGRIAAREILPEGEIGLVRRS